MAIPIAGLLEKHVSRRTVVYPEHARFSCDVQSCTVPINLLPSSPMETAELCKVPYSSIQGRKVCVLFRSWELLPSEPVTIALTSVVLEICPIRMCLWQWLCQGYWYRPSCTVQTSMWSAYVNMPWSMSNTGVCRPVWDLENDLQHVMILWSTWHDLIAHDPWDKIDTTQATYSQSVFICTPAQTPGLPRSWAELSQQHCHKQYCQDQSHTCSSDHTCSDDDGLQLIVRWAFVICSSDTTSSSDDTSFFWQQPHV